MLKRSLIIAAVLCFSVCAASAQTPDPDATAAARSLVETMKLNDRFKAILPIILQGLKPAFVQDKPDVERDFDALVPKMTEAFAPYYSGMVDAIAAIYADNFTAQELRDIETFYRQPTGQKLLAKTQTILQQSMLVGQAFGKKAAEDLAQRMADELRKRGHDVPGK
jgi:uncharacterized protein